MQEATPTDATETAFGADEVEELLAALIAVPSINPGLAADGTGEQAIADFVGEWLIDAGCTVEPVVIDTGRVNVIATVEGERAGPTLMLNSHLDTVGVAGMSAPFQARVGDGRMYGRGAADTKGGLAANMLVLAELAGSRDFAGRVVLTAVCDEESGSIGTRAVAESMQADGAIVVEPSGLRLCVRHKGFAWFTVTTEGRAAHGSLVDEGRDAITAMGSVLVELEGLAASLADNPKDPLLGAGSVHASLIEGGTEMSTYPAECRLRYERRTIPGETRAYLAGELEQLLARAGEGNPEFRVGWTLDAFESPLDVSADAEVVLALQASAVSQLGQRLEFMGGSGWTDAALLSAAGIPTVICGPNGGDHHTPGEWVDLPSVLTFAQLVVGAAREFCR